MSKGFDFKEFRVEHDRCGMKVGTDSILLGSWANINEAKHILDIGTGSGLIALMAAQRNKEAHIDAVEIDSDAAIQASANAMNSPWVDRIEIINKKIQDWNPKIEYDHIISNPPFFDSHFHQNSRGKARSQSSLTHAELLRKVSALLSKSGFASFIIPFDNEKTFLHQAKKYGLFPSRICRVRGLSSLPVKRSLLEFSLQNTPVVISQLTIESERHNYTYDYQMLTHMFYLHMDKPSEYLT